jgi:hypothetical protein
VGLSPALLANTFTISAVNGGAATGSPKLNLDTLALGNAAQVIDAQLQVSFTGSGGVVQNSSNGLYAAPFVSGSNGVGFGSPDQPNGIDGTRYLSTGIGSVVLNFGASQTYFGLLWGSVDNYNTLAFYDGADLVGTFSGLDVWAAANGNQGQQGTFYVNFESFNGSFNRIVATSTNYAFEFDNIAYNSRQQSQGVPDGGSTLALFGIAAVVMLRLGRKA